MSLSILIVDDDVSIRETLGDFFEMRGHRARLAPDGATARRLAEEDAPDVVLIDLRLPDIDGLTLQRILLEIDPELSLVLLTGHGDVPTAVHAMQMGAVDFLQKPVDLEALERAILRAAELGRLRREVALRRARDLAAASAAGSDGTTPSERGSLSTGSPDLGRLIELAAKNIDVPVLIVGETGTGKGFVARRIHEASPQRSAPFIEINCASLSATFLESELFGHERGAFTDAKQAKRGLLEVAGSGTAFLDEVGELAPAVQPKLLKVLEERSFRRLGGTTELRSGARVLAATNQPLGQLVERGSFRADLFYRLDVLTIDLPPLRARRVEISSLVRAFLPRGAALSAHAFEALQAYDWPGNIRELKNVLWRAALLADGAVIEQRHLGLPPRTLLGKASKRGASLTLAHVERLAIEEALLATGGNKARAARLLGIARSTLMEKLRRAERVDAGLSGDEATRAPDDTTLTGSRT